MFCRIVRDLWEIPGRPAALLTLSLTVGGFPPLFHRKSLEFPRKRDGGRGGIRTHGSLATTSDFESDALDHSATLPTADFTRLLCVFVKAYLTFVA